MPQLDAKLSTDTADLAFPIGPYFPPDASWSPPPTQAETFLVPPLLASQGSSPGPAHPSQDLGHILQPKASDTFQTPMACGPQFWNRAVL